MRNITWLVGGSLLASMVGACGDGAPGAGGSDEAVSAVQLAATKSAATYYIERKRLKLEGTVADLGEATSEVLKAPLPLAMRSVYYRTFENGVLVHSDSFGVILITQVMLDKWLSFESLPAPAGTTFANLMAYVGPPRADYTVVAEPTSHELGTFERGAIVAHGSNSHLVYGDVWSRYFVEDVSRALGLPLGDETASVGAGRVQAFEFGEIHVVPDLGTFVVYEGPVFDRWYALGGPGGSLGFPTADSIAVIGEQGPLGSAGHFQNGAIFASDTTGAWEVTGNILLAYETRNGGPAGWLGFPLGAPGVAGSGDLFTDFQGGVLVDHAMWDGFQGVNAFGRLNFNLARIEGWGTDCALGSCGDVDLYTYVDLSSSYGTTLDHVRFPGSGDYGTDQKDLNKSWEIGGVANSSVWIDAAVSVRDFDDTSPNDRLGDFSASYSIDNLWGAVDGALRRVDGDAAATFSVQAGLPEGTGDFRSERWWSFQNFSTPHLSFDQFSRTFGDVGQYEEKWRHPFNWIWYTAAFEGIAKNGNCFGMSLESIYSENGRSSYEQPIFPQYFPDTVSGIKLIDAAGSPAHLALMDELNIKQGYQLGATGVAWFIAKFATGNTRNPEENLWEAELFHNTGDWPMVSLMSHQFGRGHTMRVTGVELDVPQCDPALPLCARIHVADPNYPQGLDAAYPDHKNYIEIGYGAVLESSFRYEGAGGWYEGDAISGDRMFIMPWRLFSHTPVTPFANPIELLENGLMVVLGSEGRTQQITDGEGRTFFDPDLTEAPSNWDDLADDGDRIPDLAMIPLTTQAVDGAPPPQIFASKGVGLTHSYEFVPAPGVAAGTIYQADFESGRLSASLKVPGTPGKPDKITAHELGTGDQAFSFELPADSEEKEITWTLAAGEKQRWAQFSHLKVVPGQKITIHLDNGGYDPVIVNDGPDTTCELTVSHDSLAATVDAGSIDVPAGTSTLQYQVPETTLAFSDEEFGDNGWLIAPVTVTLTAQDFSGLGIDHVEYSNDQADWTSSPDDTNVFTFEYAEEGATTLYYRAIDNDRNFEDPKSEEIKIDTRRPEVDVTVEQPTMTRVDAFVIDFDISDPMPGSGIDSVVALLDGTTVSDNQSIDLLWYALGQHDLEVTATDAAGWYDSDTGTFELIATLASLHELILELRRRGEIDSDGVSNSLLSTLEAATAAYDRGARKTALNNLSTLMRDAKAQSGKHVTTRAATLLNGDIGYVMNHLP